MMVRVFGGGRLTEEGREAQQEDDSDCTTE